jgi:hypothetical protein
MMAGKLDYGGDAGRLASFLDHKGTRTQLLSFIIVSAEDA